MKILIFLGTVRDSTPPRPARLGERVAKAIQRNFAAGFPEYELELIDAMDFETGVVFKPHFAYSKTQAPAGLNALADKISAADGFIMVSPEYNHSMSPALANLLNHFGSSLFAYKPSSIVTYSAGQWGGARAAVGLRNFLSELGCLPVSAMIHVPKAQQVFVEDGSVAESEDATSWREYVDRALRQLTWWAEAAAEQRARVDPHTMITDFKKDPSQRNAPQGKKPPVAE